jgi:hypothetical protein
VTAVTIDGVRRDYLTWRPVHDDDDGA